MSKYRSAESMIRAIMGGADPLMESHAPALSIPEPDRVADALKVLHGNGISSAARKDDNTITLNALDMLTGMNVLDNALRHGLITAKPLVSSAEAIDVPETTPEPHPVGPDPTPPNGGVKLGEDTTKAETDDSCSQDLKTGNEVRPRSYVNRAENQIKKIDEEEQIDEISTKLADSYLKKAVDKDSNLKPERIAGATMIARKANKMDGIPQGIRTPKVALTREETEAEQIDELKYSTVANYQSASKTHLRSLSQARAMAGDHKSVTNKIDAKIAARKKGIESASKQKSAKILKAVNESDKLVAVKRALDFLAPSAEQIDELSKGTLERYADKNAEGWNKRVHDRDEKGKRWTKKLQHTHEKRYKGEAMAADKLSGHARVNAKEEVEPIEEISQSTLRSYVDKAQDQKRSDFMKGNRSRYFKRDAGVKKAVSKMNEEEQIDELSKGTLRSYIAKNADDHKDRIKNKPHDSTQSRHKMNRALGMNAARNKLGEEAEQLDEISRDTLRSYISKSHQADDRDPGKRDTGIKRAVTSLAKKNVHRKLKEEVELLDEGKKDELEAASKHFAKHPRADKMTQDIIHAAKHHNYVQDASDHVYSNNCNHVKYEDWHKMKPHIEHELKARGLD